MKYYETAYLCPPFRTNIWILFEHVNKQNMFLLLSLQYLFPKNLKLERFSVLDKNSPFVDEHRVINSVKPHKTIGAATEQTDSDAVHQEVQPRDLDL